MAALLVSLFLAASSGPKFIVDDYANALEQAKAQKKLLFVDAWAPWCHTCVAMKEQVFTRPAFRAFEKDVVFASIDTERTKNAAFLEKFPIEVWPTLFFIDPVKETVVFKWMGSADELQMQALLQAARAGSGTFKESDAGQKDAIADKPEATLSTGDVKTQTVLSMLAALTVAKQFEGCARTTLEQLSLFVNAQARVAAITWGLGCAIELPRGKEKEAVVDSLVREGMKALPLEGALPDDTSGLYEVLVAERQAASDEVGALKLATQWLQFLDAQAAQAPTKAARAVFDPHRVSAALASNQAQKMIEPLLLSEKDFPQDYNPPARLAIIYRELGRLDEGLKASTRALSKCKEGPRKLRLYETKASLQDKKGDAAGRRKTLEEAVRYAKQLPRTQVSEQRIAALEAQLAKK